MKKILALLIIISMVMIAIPAALAQEDYPEGECAWDECNPAYDYDVEGEPGTDVANIVTLATVGSTGGGSGGELDPDAPIIKCKWEYDLDVTVDLADCPDCDVPAGCHDDPWTHDACVCIDGLQVKPDLGETVTVGYYAIVTDPQGISTVDRVYADIWHPDGEFKYQIQLFPVGYLDTGTGVWNNDEAIGEWEHAKLCHSDLITRNDDWFLANLPVGMLPNEDIDDELGEKMAYLYYGVAELSYCQPGGWYTVGITAFDNGNNQAEYLYNRFWYIPVAAVDIDFSSIDYGSIEIGFRKQVGGDDDLSTELKPTVRNIGNTPVALSVNQSDMNFGETDGIPNVHFDSRMGITGVYVNYDPDIEVEIPGILALCSKDKLDFGITATKGTNGLTYTGSLLLRACIDMDSYVWATPDSFEGDAPLGVEDPLTSWPEL